MEKNRTKSLCLKLGVAASLIAAIAIARGESFSPPLLPTHSESTSYNEVSQNTSLVQRIYSHPFYAGHIAQFLPGSKNKIYDVLDGEGRLHFYFQGPEGLRHFSPTRVDIGGLLLTGLQNGDYQGRTFSLSDLLECQWAI